MRLLVFAHCFIPVLAGIFFGRCFQPGLLLQVLAMLRAFQAILSKQQDFLFHFNCESEFVHEKENLALYQKMSVS